MSEGVKLRVLLASSEVVGFSKTGGLADVAGSLPVALARRGLECAVITPLYRCSRSAPANPEPTSISFSVPVGTRSVPGRLWHSTLPGGVTVWLVENADYFERDDRALGRGLYQLTSSDGSQRDYPDNCERFVFFNRAILEALRLLDYWPDVLHCNDWQTGLVPVYLREVYQRQADLGLLGPESRLHYHRARTLLTIHNIAFQGVFWHWDMKLTGLDWKLFNHRQLEYYGNLSFLKAGIVFADLLSTVSPTYAREIQTPYFGCGMQGILAERADRLFGIVNGVDYSVWDPGHDPHLPANYTALTFAAGKAVCKRALQERMKLRLEPHTLLLGVVARLTSQKGVDLIAEAVPRLMAEGVQLVVLGEGERGYHQVFAELARRYPGQMGLLLGFDEALAHRIEAGSDFFLMPSHFEPSGLNQLYSLRYGTPPIVRATGGLADTVTDTNPSTLSSGTATGFRFQAHSASALLDAVRRALDLYRNQPEQLATVIRTGMGQDWSWDRSAGEYERLYNRLCGRREARG